jgi:hypothetical protein
VSDYLSALAARVVGGAGAMQPRMASRYESAEAWDRAPADDAAGVEPAESLDRLPAGRHVGPAPSRPERRLSAGRRAGFQPAIPGESVPAGSLLNDRHDAGPTFADFQAATPGESVPAGSLLPAGSALDDRQGAGPTKGDFRVATHGESVPAGSLLNDRQDAGPTKSDPQSGDATRPEPTPPGQSRTRAVVRQQGIAHAIERLRARREPAGAAGREAAPAPIEITIGRIDIRAVVATPPQRPKGKPGPRLTTLEEYAAKRSGGGR